jgi:hypothetical protein
MADAPVVPLSVSTESHDFRFRGPSLHERCGGRVHQFDDRLDVRLVGGSIRFVGYSSAPPCAQRPEDEVAPPSLPWAVEM